MSYKTRFISYVRGSTHPGAMTEKSAMMKEATPNRVTVQAKFYFKGRILADAQQFEHPFLSDATRIMSDYIKTTIARFGGTGKKIESIEIFIINGT